MSNVDRVEIYMDGQGQYRWRALAANNKTLASGESYFNYDDVVSVVQGMFGDDVRIVRV